MRNVTGLDGQTFSPHARDRIILAAAETHSYARAEHALAVLSEIEISSRQINRLTDEAGRELREQQQQRVALHAQKQLPVEVENIPELGVIETDGGRIRTRETESGSGTHHPAWRESKTALFMRMASETHEHDPAPDTAGISAKPSVCRPSRAADGGCRRARRRRERCIRGCRRCNLGNGQV